jgi:hypothetical protein
MKPHSVLIVVEKPLPSATMQSERAYQNYRHGLPRILGIMPASAVLSENVFLLSLESGMSAPSQIFGYAELHDLKYRAHFFVEAPDWVLPKSDAVDVTKIS